MTLLFNFCKILHKIIVIIFILLPSIIVAKQITVNDLLQTHSTDEPFDKRILRAGKTVYFKQVSASTNANTIGQVRLSYFRSNNCSGALSGSGSFTTSSSTSPYNISVGSIFGLVAASTWNVGISLGINFSTTTIQSIAVTLKSSTTSNTPQAAITNQNGNVLSYACIAVTCASGTCAPSGTAPILNFTLKTTTDLGDPVDGGVIGCQGGAPSLNLVVTTSNQSTAQTWSGSTAIAVTATNNQALTGSANTTAIVNAVIASGTGDTNYAALTCQNLSVNGGYNSDWFLPAGTNVTTANSQLNCFYINRADIATGSIAAGGTGFNIGGAYWTSSQSNTNNAWAQAFSTLAAYATTSKVDSRIVRCARRY